MKRKYWIPIMIISIIFASFVIFNINNTSNNSSNKEITIKIGEDTLSSEYVNKKDVQVKAKEEYKPLNESLNFTIKYEDVQSLKPTIVNKEKSLLNIDYDEEEKPDIIQIQIDGMNEFYYWDYKLKDDDKIISFELPSDIYENQGIYNIQVNSLWIKNKLFKSIVQVNKQYNFVLKFK